MTSIVRRRQVQDDSGEFSDTSQEKDQNNSENVSSISWISIISVCQTFDRGVKSITVAQLSPAAFVRSFVHFFANN